MKTLVSSLGFDADQVFKALLEYDVERSDRIVLFRPEDEDPRGKSAIREIEGMVDRMYGNIRVEVEYADPRDFERAVESVMSRIEEARGDVIVNLGGGDRGLLVAMTVATVFSDAEVEVVSGFSDAFLESFEIPLPRFESQLDERDLTVLAILSESGELSCSELADVAGLSPSTVSRRLSSLEEKGYVVRRSEGREKPVELTFKGRLAL